MVALLASAAAFVAIPNRLFDRIVEHGIDARTNFRVRIEGARVRGAFDRIDFDRIAISRPVGTGEDLGEVRSGQLIAESGGRFSLIAASAEFRVLHAANGDSLLDGLLSNDAAVRSMKSIAIESLAIRLDDKTQAIGAWLRDGRLRFRDDGSTILDFAAHYESGSKSAPLELHFERTSASLAAHLSAHGIDLAPLSPLFAAFCGGFQGAGQIDVELDATADLARRHFALAGEGTVAGLALVIPTLSPAASFGERLVKIHGGIDLDLTARKIVAQSFALESEFIYATANGSNIGGASAPSPAPPLSATLSVNLDRGALAYGPLLDRLFPAAHARGLVEFHLDPLENGFDQVKIETERLVVDFKDHASLRLFDNRIEGRIDATPDRIEVRSARFANAVFDVRGDCTLATPAASEPTLTASLEGTIQTQRVPDPISAYFGALPLQMNGELHFKTAIDRTPEETRGTLSFDTVDTAIRYDDMRNGHGDVFDFRGEPMHGEVTFALPRHSRAIAKDLRIDAKIAAAKAIVLRDELTDLELPVRLENAHLVLGPWHAGLFGGAAEGRVEIAQLGTDSPTVSARLATQDSELKLFSAVITALATGVTVAPLAPFRTTATNRVRGQIDVTGRGNSLSDVLASLDGSGVVDVGPGIITGAPVLDRFFADSNDSQKGHSIDRLHSEFVIADGTLHADSVELLAGQRSLRLRGETTAGGFVAFVIDPADWFPPELGSRLNSLRTKLRGDSIRIEGRFDSPRLHLPDCAAWRTASDAELERLVAEFEKSER